LKVRLAATMADRYDAFRAGLRELGYVEGVNIRLEYRYADGFLDRLPALAAELVRLQPRVIVSAPVPANLAASKATNTIPIVMANGADPVSFGLAQSLSRPGGNVTGLTNFAEDLAPKQIDVIRELLPHLARVGALINVENPLHVPQWQETQDAAAKASLALVHFDYRIPDDLGVPLRTLHMRRSRRFWFRPTLRSQPIGRVLQNWRRMRDCQRYISPVNRSWPAAW
jgi:putative tryptophan/tyrosine transport system substrate-binding protein